MIELQSYTTKTKAKWLKLSYIWLRVKKLEKWDKIIELQPHIKTIKFQSYTSEFQIYKTSITQVKWLCRNWITVYMCFAIGYF